CEVFQMFTRAPQGGHVFPLDASVANEFLTNCKKTKQKEWYVHAPYFINFASSNNRIRFGSVSAIKKELERASMLKTKYVMAHLGSYKDLGPKEGLKQVAEGLKLVLEDYKGKTQLLIENSAGAGAIIGDVFEEIAEIIHHPKLRKYKLGLCYDTQHGFASGYDIRTPEAVAETLKKLDKTIGLKNLKLFHCNDSLSELGSRKDRHAHIGEGLIGKKGFEALLGDKRLKDLSFVCETEYDGAENDIAMLKKLRTNINSKIKAPNTLSSRDLP
ncbi:deoxyribonuclease IV, partial [Patescibacteria group bacterium]|nr:deoxyribonuclease IV [Patescibacteria group bacterium]